ncbi:MAG: hypothetical protein ACI9LN_003846 [Saprospiraceae bacterium]|jgi:hypothetical protein
MFKLLNKSTITFELRKRGVKKRGKINRKFKSLLIFQLIFIGNFVIRNKN